MFNGATVGACAAKITEREKKRDGERENISKIKKKS